MIMLLMKRGNTNINIIIITKITKKYVAPCKTDLFIGLLLEE